MDFIFNLGALEKIAGGSDAYVHRVKDVFDIAGAEREIASLQLPAGSWVVLAKAVAGHLNFESRLDVQCRLTVSSTDRLAVADSAEDTATSESGAAVVPDIPIVRVVHGKMTMTLLLGVDLRAGGYVHLRAGAGRGGYLTDIVIGAIRVNSLTVTTISTPQPPDTTDYNPELGSRPIAYSQRTANRQANRQRKRTKQQP